MAWAFRAPPASLITSVPAFLGFIVAFYLFLKRRTTLGVREQFSTLAGRDNRVRIGVVNLGPSLAENVEMLLSNISPRPRDMEFGADFPYRVVRASVGRFESRGCSINPHEEEKFELLIWWISGDNRFIVDGINTKARTTDVPRPRFVLERDERWQLSYTVTAANARRVEFSIIVKVEDGSVSVVRDGSNRESSAANQGAERPSK